MQFEFATATRILFGTGARKDLPGAAKSFGRRALIVTGRRSEPALQLAAELRREQVESVLFSGEGEPTLAQVIDGAGRAKAEKCDLVLALGGGSALDAGKAIAAMMTNPGELTDYLEVIGRGRTSGASRCSLHHDSYDRRHWR